MSRHWRGPRRNRVVLACPYSPATNQLGAPESGETRCRRLSEKDETGVQGERRWCSRFERTHVARPVSALREFHTLAERRQKVRQAGNAALTKGGRNLGSARCSVLGARCSVLGARCSVLGARCSVLGARCSVLGARCSVLGARCSVLNYTTRWPCQSQPFREHLFRTPPLLPLNHRWAQSRHVDESALPDPWQTHRFRHSRT